MTDTTTIETWAIDNVEELAAAVEELQSLLRRQRCHPSTVYTGPHRMALVQETLTDGSHVLNLTIADRPERTFAHLPERCPSNHWNGGDDICADCGTDLNPPTSRPKFKVLVQQYVEQTAIIEVEADTPQAARQMVLDKDMMVTADWKDGDDAYEADVYAVKDEADSEVWLRDVDPS